MPVLNDYLNVVEAAVILGVHWENGKAFLSRRLYSSAKSAQYMVRIDHYQLSAQAIELAKEAN